MKRIHNRSADVPKCKWFSHRKDRKRQGLTHGQLEQYRRFLLYDLNIRLLCDHLLYGDAIGARMLWLCDLEQIVE